MKATRVSVVIEVTPPARGSRTQFGRTWWGRAWVEALEGRARIDPNRLPRGRTYAKGGTVGELTFTRGEVEAKVQGRRVRPYTVRVRVRVFTDDEWARVLDSVAGQLGHTAALLDGELPPEVAADVARAGLDLLPGAGEVGTSCSCPDSASPCKHAAAVCYLIAEASDADPFVLLLLRGRSREEILAELRSRRRAPEPGAPASASSSAAAGQAETDEGVDARAAFAAGPLPAAPIPALPLPPAGPGIPAPLPSEPAQSPVSRDDLAALAADAARRAWELAVGAGDGGLALDRDADIARWAGQLLGTPAFPRLVERLGMNGRELARQGLAWRYGAAGGLATLHDDGRWTAAAPVDVTTVDVTTATAAGKAALAALSGGRPRVTRNRVTVGAAQLRLGRDGLWYPYTKSGDDWDPAGAPHPDPTQAAAVL